MEGSIGEPLIEWLMERRPVGEAYRVWFIWVRRIWFNRTVLM